MDLLLSLGIDELPEQQTRTVHLISQNPDFDLALGFDACCTCGLNLASAAEVSIVAVSCDVCRRVKYCSESCRHQDANASSTEVVKESVTNEGDVLEEEAERALGHCAVICALLNVCNDDEAVEENSISGLDEKRIHAAQDRIRSEYESYPATIANAINQGPCYETVLKKRSISSETLVIHVLGASEEAELWGGNKDAKSDQVYQAYAEALSELSDRRGIDSIELICIGPDCPEQDLRLSLPMRSTERDSVAGQLSIRTCRGLYTKELLEQKEISAADIAVFFNPGFTVPEYNWNEALASIKKGTPFLSTTNTELEGIADCQYLLDQDKVQSIPPGLASIFDLYSEGDIDDNDSPQNDVNSTTGFFSVNPFSGSRVRQSGTMANDLFVKNRWMLGGILDSYDPSKEQIDGPSKKRKTGVPSNCKASNPALI